MKAKFESGDVKAWCLMRGDSYLWTSVPDNVHYEAVREDDGETPVFTQEALAAMNDGDVVKGDVWTVECHLVDGEWLDNLPEFDCDW